MLCSTYSVPEGLLSSDVCHRSPDLVLGHDLAIDEDLLVDGFGVGDDLGDVEANVVHINQCPRHVAIAIDAIVHICEYRMVRFARRHRGTYTLVPPAVIYDGVRYIGTLNGIENTKFLNDGILSASTR